MTEGPGKIRKVNRPDYERAIESRLVEGWEVESRGEYITKLTERSFGDLGWHVAAFVGGSLLGGGGHLIPLVPCRTGLAT